MTMEPHFGGASFCVLAATDRSACVGNDGQIDRCWGRKGTDLADTKRPDPAPPNERERGLVY